MKHPKLMLLAVSICFIASACNAPKGIEASSEASHATEASSSSAAPQPENGTQEATAPATALAELTVTPSSVGCESVSTPVVAEVSWRVEEPSVKEVLLKAGTAGAPETMKLLSQGLREGHVKTDEWVSFNTVFELTDMVSGKVLAEHRMSESLTCP